MADTDVNAPETGTPEAPKNNATPVATPVVNATDAEVERLRKEAEQARMEANMLRNKLKAEEDAKAAAEAKKLEEQQQFKDLYEQERTKRQEIEREREAEAKRQELEGLKAKTLGEYSADVKDAAEKLGITLSDATDEAVQEYRAKLDTLNTRSGGQRVTANNPGTPSGRQEVTPEQLREIMADPERYAAWLRANKPVTAQMMRPQQ